LGGLHGHESNLTLDDGQSWKQPYEFSIRKTGVWKVQFLLFRESDLSLPHREVHLYVTASS